jgi:predicted RNA binding protein YcfA (HicA-like mRNA interferase family)
MKKPYKQRDLERLATQNGWKSERQTGGHRIWIHPGHPERGHIIFPNERNGEMADGTRVSMYKRIIGAKTSRGPNRS